MLNISYFSIMCYSTSLRKPIKKIEEKLREPFNATFEVSVEYQPYYHLNGFTHANLQIIKMDDTENIVPASWGLIPQWAMHDPTGFRKKSNTLNARSESIFDKASFRDSASDKRCLILADGFYIWKNISKKETRIKNYYKRSFCKLRMVTKTLTNN